MRDNFTDWCELPTDYGTLRMYDTGDEGVHLITHDADIEALTASAETPLVRVHSSCAASEIFGAIDCDCNAQLQESLRMISAQKGMVIYLQQEGRGHGIGNKIKICQAMQDKQLDTVEACQHLQLDADIRDYSKAIALLKSLHIAKLKLISNNPRKYDFITQHGIDIVENITLSPYLCALNKDYMISKKQKLGHEIMLDMFLPDAPDIYFCDNVCYYHGFSNFSPYAVLIDDKIWHTTEHYYQACKFTDDAIISKIRSDILPFNAKKIAHSYQQNMRADWDNIKQQVMRNALYHKFTQHPELRTLLLSTGDKMIYEYSANDFYWGNNGKQGQNHLGKIIMQLRDEMGE